MNIDKELLEILACPRCRGRIRPSTRPEGLACDACRLLYRIDDGIPVMLIEEARPLVADATPA